MILDVSANMTQIVTLAYGVMGFVALAGYGPQLLAFWKSPLVCQNTPLATWAMWAVQTVVFHVYAWMVNGDHMFILTTGMFMVATLACLGLVVRGKVLAAKDRLTISSNVVPLKRVA